MKKSFLTPRQPLESVKRLILLAALLPLAIPAAAQPIAYEPFDYPPGELLCPLPAVPQREFPDGHFWISGTSLTIPSDAAIVAGNLTVPGLAPPSGNSFTNGGAGQSPRFVINTRLTNGTVYASYAMRIDKMGDSFIGENPNFIVSLCFNNAQGTLIQYCNLLVNINGVDQTSFSLGVRQISGTTMDVYSPTLYPVEETLFIVHGYTFVDGESNDINEVWINPDSSTFGTDTPPTATLTAFQPAGMTDAFWIDRINFRQGGVARAPAAMTYDELRMGTNWSGVTPLPVPPPPQIISIAGAGTASVTVTWTNALVGTNYVLQFNTNLSTTDWSDLAPVTATDSTAFQTDNPPSGDAARFYRVLRQ
jgi:hypothetical protein